MLKNPMEARSKRFINIPNHGLHDVFSRHFRGCVATSSYKHDLSKRVNSKVYLVVPAVVFSLPKTLNMRESGIPPKAYDRCQYIAKRGVLYHRDFERIVGRIGFSEIFELDVPNLGKQFAGFNLIRERLGELLENLWSFRANQRLGHFKLTSTAFVAFLLSPKLPNPCRNQCVNHRKTPACNPKHISLKMQPVRELFEKRPINAPSSFNAHTPNHHAGMPRKESRKTADRRQGGISSLSTVRSHSSEQLRHSTVARRLCTRHEDWTTLRNLANASHPIYRQNRTATRDVATLLGLIQ